MNSALRSVFAVLVGILAGLVPTLACDFVLQISGVLDEANFAYSPLWLLLMLISYRFLWNTVGCYVCARLAPKAPMAHCMFIGVLGAVLSVVATLSMPEAGPMWYGLAVAAISVPSAWLGARFFLSRSPSPAQA